MAGGHPSFPMGHPTPPTKPNYLLVRVPMEPEAEHAFRMLCVSQGKKLGYKVEELIRAELDQAQYKDTGEIPIR